MLRFLGNENELSSSTVVGWTFHANFLNKQALKNKQGEEKSWMENLLIEQVEKSAKMLIEQDGKSAKMIIEQTRLFGTQE